MTNLYFLLEAISAILEALLSLEGQIEHKYH